MTGVWNEGKISPGGWEMATSGGEGEECRLGLLTKPDQPSSAQLPSQLLHMTHLCRMLLINFLTPTIQYPALRIADSVNTRP